MSRRAAAGAIATKSRPLVLKMSISVNYDCLLIFWRGERVPTLFSATANGTLSALRYWIKFEWCVGGSYA